MPTEHDIQNTIRLEFSRLHPDAYLFRVNVGEGWTGNPNDIHYDRVKNILTIKNPRRFKTGLPNGFSDLMGILPGGRALFVEVKTDRGKPTEAQVNFLRQMSGIGALAGVARGMNDVIRIIKGEG